MSLKKRQNILCSLTISLLIISTLSFTGGMQYLTDVNSSVTHHELADTTLEMSGELLYEINYNYTGNQYPAEILETSDGNYVFVGYTQCAGPTTDVWLQKVNISGYVLWNRTFDGGSSDYGRTVIETSDGGFLLASSCNNGTDHYDIWVIKTDSEGHHLWNQTFDRVYNNYPKALIGLENDDFLIFGQAAMGSPAGPLDFWMIRANASGHHIWNTTIGGPEGENAFKAIEHSSGSFISCGWYRDPVNLTLDAYLVALDGDGNLLWNKTYGIVGIDEAAYDLRETESGDIIFSGWTDITENDRDIWIVRTDSNGNHLWNKTYGISDGEIADSMTSNAYGGFTLSCRTYSYVTDTVDILIMKIDEDGNVLWNFTYGTADNDINRDIIELNLGGYCVISYRYNSAAGTPFSCELRVLPEPRWLSDPSDVTFDATESIIYDLNATSVAPLSWKIDNSSFSISSEGVITNATTLSQTEYPLSVTVTDSTGNILTGSFTLTVNPTSSEPTTPEDDNTLLYVALLLVGVTVALVVIVMYQRRKQT
ncbi:MAG: hypothetical protein ACTSV2_10355 [Candidatus Thorarchaeota archaeon]